MEEDLKVNEIIVFAGETLGLLTNGIVRAPLHYVAPLAEMSSCNYRCSMPFFLRARPEAMLTETMDTKMFMEKILPMERLWKRNSKKNAACSDY